MLQLLRLNHRPAQNLGTEYTEFSDRQHFQTKTFPEIAKAVASKLTEQLET